MKNVDCDSEEIEHEINEELHSCDSSQNVPSPLETTPGLNLHQPAVETKPPAVQSKVKCFIK